MRQRGDKESLFVIVTARIDDDDTHPIVTNRVIAMAREDDDTGSRDCIDGRMN